MQWKFYQKCLLLFYTLKISLFADETSLFSPIHVINVSAGKLVKT